MTVLNEVGGSADVDVAVLDALTVRGTTIRVQSATGLATPAPGEYQRLALYGVRGVNAWEIVYVTARTGQFLTVLRAQEGTEPTAWTRRTCRARSMPSEPEGAGGGGGATIADADPGAIGADKLWLQTNIDGYAVQLWIRNATDDGWIAVTPAGDSGTYLFAPPEEVDGAYGGAVFFQGPNGDNGGAAGIEAAGGKSGSDGNGGTGAVKGGAGQGTGYGGDATLRGGRSGSNNYGAQVTSYGASGDGGGLVRVEGGAATASSDKPGGDGILVGGVGDDSGTPVDGAYVVAEGGQADGTPGGVLATGGAGANNISGGDATLRGGTGHDGVSGAAEVIASGGEDSGQGGSVQGLAGDGGAGSPGGAVILNGGTGDGGTAVPGAALVLNGGLGDGTGGVATVQGGVSVADQNGGYVELIGGPGDGSTTMGAGLKLEGGSGDGVTPGRAVVTGILVLNTPLICRVAAGVPAGAPTAGENGMAIDTTAVTGGLYAWSGSAWVRGSVIP